MKRPRKILTIGHSYVVALNRRLAHELAQVSPANWQVTAVAPEFVHGDLRPIPFEASDHDACRVELVSAYLSKYPHFFCYGTQTRELVRSGWDLVHCWEEPYIFSGFQIAQWTRAKTPFVFWTAQNLLKRYPPPFTWFERFCFRRANGWIGCGKTTLDAMNSRGYSKKPHRVLPLGVDVDIFKPDATLKTAAHRLLDWAAGPPVVGYLGRFVPEKGIRILTSALDQTKSFWRALFVGGGPLEAEIRSWAIRYGDRVRIISGVPHQDVPRYLNAMDILVAPSQTSPRWKEQLGRMIIEAFACGVAVIGSDSGEIPYVIGDAGLIISENDVVNWVATLDKLLDSPSKRNSLTHAGRCRALSEFAWPVVARRHIDFFDSLT